MLVVFHKHAGYQVTQRYRVDVWQRLILLRTRPYGANLTTLFAREWIAKRHKLIYEDSKGPYINLMVVKLGVQLLRWHILWGADDGR